MKRNLRILALMLALVSVFAWALLGANPGWTRTSQAVKTVDEITGIEGIHYEKKFVPGVELLGAAILGAGLLASSSFLFRSTKIKTE